MRPQRLVGDNVAVLSDRTDRTLAPVYTATVHVATATNYISNHGLCTTFPILRPLSARIVKLLQIFFFELTD